MSKFTKAPYEVVECHCKNVDCPIRRIKNKEGQIIADDLSEEDAKLFAAAPDAHALLKAGEWSGRHEQPYCRYCVALQTEGHADNCALAVYFKTVEG